MNRICLIPALSQLVSPNFEADPRNVISGIERVPAAADMSVAVDALIVLNNKAVKNEANNEANSTGH